MRLQAKSHLARPRTTTTLVVALLVPLVVSGKPTSLQHHTNEATSSFSFDSTSSSILSDSLIARAAAAAENHLMTDRLQLERDKRRALGGQAESLFTAAHQQSTNALATRRDLQQKQLRQQQEQQATGRIVRGVADSTTIADDDGRIAEKRAPAEEINGLRLGRYEEAHEREVEEESRSNVIYASSQPGPLVYRKRKELGDDDNVFELTNLSTESIDELESDDLSRLKLSDVQENIETDDEYIFKDHLNGSNNLLGFALFHRIIDNELDDNASSSSPGEEHNVTENLLLSGLKKSNEHNGSKQRNGDTIETYQKETGFNVNGSSGETEVGKYEFGYRVSIDRPATSDHGHEENRTGLKTSGKYHVLLPDGRIQVVRYVADQSGYRAQISYADNTTIDEKLS